MVRAASDLNDFVFTTSSNFFNELCATELLLSEMINVCNRGGTSGLGDEINLVSINILNDHNVFLSQEMKSKFIYCISEN